MVPDLRSTYLSSAALGPPTRAPSTMKALGWLALKVFQSQAAGLAGQLLEAWWACLGKFLPKPTTKLENTNHIR